MDETAEQMFGYLRDILYDPAHATLDLDNLPEEFRVLGEGLLYFGESVQQLRGFASALAKGNLSVQPPPPSNELASPLKSLQSSLRHVTWQSKQVAKGDYQQRVEFMGEFADAFNIMIQQLDSRQKALEAEIENGRKKTLALKQSNSLFEAITANLPQMIFVVNKRTKKRLFVNPTAENMLAEDKIFAAALGEWLIYQTDIANTEEGESGQHTMDIQLPTAGKTRYYSVSSYPIHWHEHNALAYVLNDVSAERERVKLLENHAYFDNLTGVHNRYSGMQILCNWLEENIQFSLCFADIDNLKYVNDNYGHSEGDEYIIAAAKLLESYGPDVIVSRLGGDEFMLMAAGCDGAEAEQRMAELRDDFIKQTGKSAADKKPYMMSISYGVVESNTGDDLTASELLGIADERMYIFKRAHKLQRRDILSK